MVAADDLCLRCDVNDLGAELLDPTCISDDDEVFAYTTRTGDGVARRWPTEVAIKDP